MNTSPGPEPPPFAPGLLQSPSAGLSASTTPGRVYSRHTERYASSDHVPP